MASLDMSVEVGVKITIGELVIDLLGADSIVADAFFMFVSGCPIVLVLAIVVVVVAVVVIILVVIIFVESVRGIFVELELDVVAVVRPPFKFLKYKKYEMIHQLINYIQR